MARSLKNGPFVDHHLLAKVEKAVAISAEHDRVHVAPNGVDPACRPLSADELARFRVFVDDLIGRIMAKGGSSYSVKHAHMKYGAAGT